MEKMSVQSTFPALIAPAALCVGMAISAQSSAQAQPSAVAGPAPASTAAAASAATPAAPSAAKAEGEVRRVDAANGRIQLRHGTIANLDMPPMTMVFRVKSLDLLEGLKEGDKILFTAEKIDGVYTVTSVERRP